MKKDLRSCIRFRWDPRRQPYSRVEQVEVHQYGASGASWKVLVDSKTYRFITNDFIANGGSGFAMLKGHRVIDLNDPEAPPNYLRVQVPTK